MVTDETRADPEPQPQPEPAAAPETREEDPMQTETAPISAEDLAAVRELALRAYPETVPELVGGATVEALLGSLEPATAAYRRIAEGVTAQPPAPAIPTVPAGSAPPVALDPERIPSVEKIRRGLASRR
jgi:hypothetical protein